MAWLPGISLMLTLSAKIVPVPLELVNSNISRFAVVCLATNTKLYAVLEVSMLGYKKFNQKIVFVLNLLFKIIQFSFENINFYYCTIFKKKTFFNYIPPMG